MSRVSIFLPTPLTKETTLSGDSYSSVGYDRFSPHPTREEPLGIPFPGVTYTEPDQPNWVGHLVSNYSLNPELRVYDFAEGGDGVFGVSLQIRNQYMRALALKPEWAPWCAEDSLFGEYMDLVFFSGYSPNQVTWVGINDCGYVQGRTLVLIDAEILSTADRVNTVKKSMTSLYCRKSYMPLAHGIFSSSTFRQST